MEIRQLTRVQIEELYKNQMGLDFPKEEIKPLELILDLVDKDVYLGYGLFEDEELKAYALLAKDIKSEWYLLDYFAVVKRYRDGGFGSSFLTSLMDMMRAKSEAVILEIELIKASRNDAERDIRTRRRNFYLKNNILITDISSSVFETEFEILYFASKEKHKRELIEEKYSDIYKTMLPLDMYEKNFVVYG